MKVVVVYNQRSGSALSQPQLKLLFQKHAIEVADWVPADDIQQATFARHVKNGATVAVVGGDGTISAAARHMAGTDATLLPLPGGTLNHFTKDLGVSQDINNAVSALAHSKVRRVDTASVNKKVFINNSSIGLYPSSLYERTSLESRVGKWPALVIASFRALLRFRVYEVRIGAETFLTPFIFIGNNHYDITSAGVAKRTRLDEGKLSVFIAKTTSRWVLLKIALLALVGRAHWLNEFAVHTASSLTIHAKHSRLHVSADGELQRLRTPIEYQIRPKSLRVRY